MSKRPPQMYGHVSLAMGNVPVPDIPLTMGARLQEICELRALGIIDIWDQRVLLGGSIPPSNPDPHAPANRKERPWHPPGARA